MGVVAVVQGVLWAVGVGAGKMAAVLTDCSL